MRLPTMFTGTSATVTVTAAVGVTFAVASAVAGAYLLAAAYSGSSDRVAVGQIGSSDHHVGAPGPVAGAGLPGIIAVGCGAYWLVGRRRRKYDTGLPRGDLKD
jgi:hypothetical protein